MESCYVNILCQPKIGDICCFVSVRPWTQGTVNQNRLRPTHHKKISSGTWEIFGLVFDRYKDGLNVSLWNLTLVLIMHTYRVQKHLKKIKCTELFFWRISKKRCDLCGYWEQTFEEIIKSTCSFNKHSRVIK